MSPSDAAARFFTVMSSPRRIAGRRLDGIEHNGMPQR